MSDVISAVPARIFASHIHTLSELGCTVTEETFRVTVAGDCLNNEQIASASAAISVYVEANAGTPVLRIDGEIATPDDLSAGVGKSWSMAMGTKIIAATLAARENEDTRLFCTVEGFNAWAQQLSPFNLSHGGKEPNLLSLVTIRVFGLHEGFGNDSLWILPCEAAQFDAKKGVNLPDDESIQRLIHVISPEKSTLISPRTWVLNWGDLNDSSAEPFLRNSCLVLAVCLSHDVRVSDAGIRVTIRGSKSHTIGLWQSNNNLPWRSLQTRLIEVVSWVYEERSETRLKLIADRLGVDINPDECWLTSLHRHMKAAFRQAKDGYGFVILDRKDAYFKEMREVMKDMKSQADLYAAKVRDLTTSLTRDILGVIVFLGFSFIGKFDREKISELLSSVELSLLLKVLCFYLLFSCVLQISSHWRDANLTRAEGMHWLEVLRNYTSSEDSKSNFLEPLANRWRTLMVAMVVSVFSYLFLFFSLWNLPFIVKSLLAWG